MSNQSFCRLALIDQIKKLKPRTAVKLNWEHRYITRTHPNGTSAKFPRRTITLLKPADEGR